jgi:hypothetical protein
VDAAPRADCWTMPAQKEPASGEVAESVLLRVVEIVAAVLRLQTNQPAVAAHAVNAGVDDPERRHVFSSFLTRALGQPVQTSRRLRTGKANHSRYCVIASVVERATSRAVCLAPRRWCGSGAGGTCTGIGLRACGSVASPANRASSAGRQVFSSIREKVRITHIEARPQRIRARQLPEWLRPHRP